MKRIIAEITASRALIAIAWVLAALWVFDVARAFVVVGMIGKTNVAAEKAVVAAEKAVVAAEKAVVAAEKRAAEVKMQLQVDALRIREQVVEQSRLLDEFKKQMNKEPK